jgi:uncharacterized membrane protein YdjX (TVP38/TMEM64 family)
VRCLSDGARSSAAAVERERTALARDATERRARRLNRYWATAAGIVAAFTVVFVVVEAADVSVLTEPRSVMDEGAAAAAAGVLLLVVDALLPVPSSIVMVLLGALFGAGAGAALSMIGRVGAAAAGFAIGRGGGQLLGRVSRPDERARADALLERWGWLAIVLSRPVPLLAESVMVLAGASPMRWRRALPAAALGSLPEAVVYGITGAAVATFDRTAAVFLALLAVAGVSWAVARRA